MSVKKTECCNMHTKEKEKLGTCCQIKDEEEKNYESSQWYLGKHNNEIGTMRQKQRSQDE